LEGLVLKVEGPVQCRARPELRLSTSEFCDHRLALLLTCTHRPSHSLGYCEFGGPVPRLLITHAQSLHRVPTSDLWTSASYLQVWRVSCMHCTARRAQPELRVRHTCARTHVRQCHPRAALACRPVQIWRAAIYRAQGVPAFCGGAPPSRYSGVACS
jgi:hypothetical protein